MCCVSRPARGGWIEINNMLSNNKNTEMSRPARGGWIEILVVFDPPHLRRVPPRTGRVD